MLSCSRNLLLMTSLLFGRFTGSASFYGLAFNISFLFGDKYLNFTISALADVGVHFVLLRAIPR